MNGLEPSNQPPVSISPKNQNKDKIFVARTDLKVEYLDEVKKECMFKFAYNDQCRAHSKNQFRRNFSTSTPFYLSGKLTHV